MSEKINSDKDKVISKVVSENTQTNPKPKSNKRFLWAGIIVFAIISIIAVTTTVILYKNQNSGETAADNNSDSSKLHGELIYIEGTVEYKEKDKDDWEKAKEGMVVSEEFIIRSADDGKAIINLDDGSAVRLNNSSEITLASMNPDKIVISNNQGEIYTRVVESEREFIVNVEDTSYISLGTAYKTTNSEDVNKVEVYHSKVSVNEEISVDEGNRYYVKNSSDPAKEGVPVELTKEELESDKFVVWNKSLDEKISDFKDKLGVLSQIQSTPETANSEDNATEGTEPSPTPTPTGSIWLTGSATESGVYLAWSISNLDAPYGFKIVKSTYANPVYPGSYYIYLSGSGSRNYTWAMTDGVTYHFRVCQYLGNGTCGTYSNDIVVTAPAKAEQPPVSSVSSISASSNGNGTVSWSVNGTATMGFKVVWSKVSGPTYPNRGTDRYLYYSDSNTRTSGVMEAFDGPGTYYVRVCEYLGGACGVYSNEVAVEL
ncbi:FecR domain-containing protein [Candidatus Dojkabacteria bacterium]|nr:FecR domain-containing protein [Candidatus Dojkabacteria bacterium]